MENESRESEIISNGFGPLGRITMRVQLRIPEKLFSSIKDDLTRPHAFASERVGFLFGRVADCASDSSVILAYNYEPVCDENYIRDPQVGARIDASAIRIVRQKIMQTQDSAFHVHAHLGRGVPRLSRVDQSQLPPVIQSFCTANPDSPHGLVIINFDSAVAHVWMPGSNQSILARIVVVGLPMLFFGGEF